MALPTLHNLKLVNKPRKEVLDFSPDPCTTSRSRLARFNITMSDCVIWFGANRRSKLRQIGVSNVALPRYAKGSVCLSRGTKTKPRNPKAFRKTSSAALFPSFERLLTKRLNQVVISKSFCLSTNVLSVSANLPKASPSPGFGQRRLTTN